MARAKSPEKRTAILEAAGAEVAAVGLGAPTAKIAERAGVATGTLFTYFANKDILLNELYLYLKRELYARIDEGFPVHGSLEKRLMHVWGVSFAWATGFPDKRKVSLQLSVSDVLTVETRAKSVTERGLLEGVLRDLEERGQSRGLPAGFATATMGAMQETAMTFSNKRPKERQAVSDQAFRAFWRMLR
jgi:AcrR family transcriptional regulator